MEREFEFYGDSDINDLIIRFEDLIQNGNGIYFDVEEFEDIIDYYDEIHDGKYMDRALDTALEIHPAHSYFKLKRAQRYSMPEKFNKSLKLLKEIIQIEPRNYGAFESLAYVYGQLGNHKKAIEIYLECINLGSEEDETWLNIALEYQNLGKYEMSLAYFKKILKNYPENEEALYEILFCYESLRLDLHSLPCELF